MEYVMIYEHKGEVTSLPKPPPTAHETPNSNDWVPPNALVPWSLHYYSSPPKNPIRDKYAVC